TLLRGHRLAAQWAGRGSATAGDSPGCVPPAQFAFSAGGAGRVGEQPAAADDAADLSLGRRVGGASASGVAAALAARGLCGAGTVGPGRPTRLVYPCQEPAAT